MPKKNISFQPEKISRFNSFQVFERFYRERPLAERTETIQLPSADKQGNFFSFGWLLLLVFLFLSIAWHPLLKYYLKTPYPLIMVTGDSNVTNLQAGDLLTCRGPVDYRRLRAGDLVAYQLMPANNKKVFLGRVITVASGGLLVETHGSRLAIKINQLRGYVINASHPWRLPFWRLLGFFWSKAEYK